MFERLVRVGDYPVQTLATQRRMRPEISKLIRTTIYPSLEVIHLASDTRVDHAEAPDRAVKKHIRVLQTCEASPEACGGAGSHQHSEVPGGHGDAAAPVFLEPQLHGERQ